MNVLYIIYLLYIYYECFNIYIIFVVSTGRTAVLESKTNRNVQFSCETRSVLFRMNYNSYFNYIFFSVFKGVQMKNASIFSPQLQGFVALYVSF